MRDIRKSGRSISECGNRWSEDKHVAHPEDWAHDERLGHKYGPEADTDFKSMRNRRLHSERDKRSLDEARIDYMDLIGKDVEIDGDTVTVIDIKEPEIRGGVEYYTVEFDDDSVIDLSPEEMDALLTNGNVWAYAQDDNGEDVFMTIVDIPESLHESVSNVQSARRRKLLESFKKDGCGCGRTSLNSKIKNKINESLWSRKASKRQVDEDFDGRRYREDRRVSHPMDWAHDEDYGRNEPLRDTQFKSERNRRLHGERIERSMKEHSADQMYVVDFNEAIEDVDGNAWLADLVDSNVISYYEDLKGNKFAVTIFGEDADVDAFAEALGEYFDEETVDYIINNPASHDVSEDEEDILESKISKIRAARLNEAKDDEVKPKSPHARKSIDGKKISLYKLDDLINLLKDYKEERKELVKDGKYADKKGDAKARKDVDKKLKMLDDKMEILTDEITFRKKNKMNESVSSKFSRKLFEADEEEEKVDVKVEDEEKPEDSDDNKDEKGDSEEDEIKDMVAIQLTVKDSNKVKDELIAAGIPEEAIEIVTESKEATDDEEAVNGEVKVDADYAIELRDYLKGKGISLEEKIGGEIITADDEENSDEKDNSDSDSEQMDLDIFGEDNKKDEE